MNNTIPYSPESIRETQSYDVAVCGGGPAGCAAALAAARRGLSVIVLEAQGQLGGMGTSGLVSHWLGGRTFDCKDWVVGGIFRELSLEGVERGIALLPKSEPDNRFSPHGWCKAGPITAGVPFDPFAMATLLDDKLAEAGSDVLFFTHCIDTITDRDRITHVIIHNKSGLQAVPAKAVIDATGDADIAARSGCETVHGREDDHLTTPVTLEMHLDHVDADTLAEYANRSSGPEKGAFRFLDEIQELMRRDEWPFAFNRLISVQLTETDSFMVNTARMTGYDGADAASVSRAMQQGRRESQELLRILRKHAPGFANARIKALAPLLGVRETRRIVGDFRLTIEDMIEDTAFPDIIGYSAYGWDLPDPNRPSDNPDIGKQRGIKKHIHAIPYRVMVPRPVLNLVCPGRAISVEREILGPLRVMAPCMAMGEAAGIAAAQVTHNQRAFAEVDPAALRTELQNRGAIVDLEV